MHIDLIKGGAKILVASILFAFIFSFFIIKAPATQAHEAYVLTEEQLQADLEASGPTAFSALKDPSNLKIAVLASIGALIALALYYLFIHTKLGKKADQWLKRSVIWDKLLLRIVLAIALIGSALSYSFLGPELPLNSLPLTHLLAPALFISGILFLLGLFTEVAAGILLVLYVAAFTAHGTYLFTYIEYLGLGILFLFFGAGKLSLDHHWFRSHKHEDHTDTEILLLRLTYAFSILYVAIGTKLMHPQVVIDIVQKFNLTQYSWLFPSSPMLIALGAGLTQVGLSLSFLAGAAIRLSALATIGLVTLSVFFFRESVWPHLPLLGIGFYLLLNNGGAYTFDQWLLHRRTAKR